MDLDALKRVLEGVGGQKVRLTGTGKDLLLTCPLSPWTHAKGSDSRPSFGVSTEGEHAWRCYACGESGRSIDALIRRIRGRGGVISPDIEKLAAKMPLSAKQPWGAWAFCDVRPMIVEATSPLDDRDEMPRYAEADVEQFSDRVPDYLTKRGVPVAQQKRWGVRYDPKTRRVIFPIFGKGDDGGMVLYGVSGRDVTGKSEIKYLHYTRDLREGRFVPWVPSKDVESGKRSVSEFRPLNKGCVFFGEQHWQPSESSVAHVVEGFLDVLALERAGVANALAMMGAGLSETQGVLLAESFGGIVIWPDGDDPGVKAAERSREMLRSLNVPVAVIDPKPYWGRDPGDLSQREAREHLSLLKSQRGTSR